MTFVEQRIDLQALNAMEPRDLVAWAFSNHGERAAIITSFQTTGCVMINMAAEMGFKPRVLTVDTLRLHHETYNLIERVERRYALKVERFQPERSQVQRMVSQHGEYLFFDSREKQEYCCKIRKVEPNKRALATVDVWITGLRRDQSGFRKGVQKAAYIEDEGRQLLKLAPLAEWTEADLWEYIQERDIPYNALYDQGYATIGCVICTTPVKPGEDKRAGRWRWFNQLDEEHHKECGIHIGGSGI